jgi:intergrase/recombinase
MKVIEFLRDVYTASGLSIKPKTRFNKIDALKEIIRAWGLNPEESLIKEALTQPHRTEITQSQLEQAQLTQLAYALKQQMLKNIQKSQTQNRINSRGEVVARKRFELLSRAPECLFKESFSQNRHENTINSLNWLQIKPQFARWMESEGYSEDFKDDVTRYLNRYITTIHDPFEIVSMFADIKKGKRHLVLALRTMLNFYEAMGANKEYLDCFRKALPKVTCGVDLKIPTEEQIVDSLRKLPKAPIKYQALYNLLLDSGLRLIEARYMINNFKAAEQVNGFYRCELAMFRGEKQAYYGHFSEYTLDLIKQAKGDFITEGCSHYYDVNDYVMPKYLRKFAFDKMIDLEIPESVADFIEGRVPKRVGAKHYMALARQASKFYPRYQNYIKQLRLT